MATGHQVVNMPSVGEVSAFIGPLIAAIALIGGFIGWLMKRASDRLKEEFKHFAEVNNERQKTNNARLEALQNILETQTKTLELQQKQVMDTAITVARIEGRMRGDGST